MIGEAFDREYGCTEADWLRWLPGAVRACDLCLGPAGTARVSIDVGTLSLQFKDDVMVGCNSIGWTDHVGVLRGLVEGQVKLGAWKEHLKQDPTRLMEAYIASAQGQSEWHGAADERRR